MEILTTATVEGKTLNLEQTINFTETNFVTIKEIFSIEDEIFVAVITHGIPHTIETNGITILTNRFIMPAKQFVAYYSTHL